MSDELGRVKQFMMTNLLLEHNLSQVEGHLGINVVHRERDQPERDTSYYPQIEKEFRSEAARMAPHYEIFYSLEKTIRAFITDALKSLDSTDWWQVSVPEKIRTDVENRRQREIDTGMTPRSDDALDFTTFGELAEIIKTNWSVFGGMLSSRKAVERVMSNLNSLRGPIAHCSALAEDEIVRLRLSVRDWFRLMD
ncbi:Swt1 family HEPN domain-containing protein [Actinophytocola sp. KF-1]